MASLRFLGSGQAASAGAIAAEAEVPARPSPPQPEPGEAWRSGWLEGLRCPRMGILFTRIWRLFNHQGEGLGPQACGSGRGSVLPRWWGLRILPECGRRGQREVHAAPLQAREHSISFCGHRDRFRLAAQPFVLKDFPKSPFRNTPIAPISIGSEKGLLSHVRSPRVARLGLSSTPFFGQQLDLDIKEKCWRFLGKKV